MYTSSIKQWINYMREGEIILAKRSYEEYFSNMKESTFYQLLARLNNEQVIGKLAKGLYYKPYKNEVYKVPQQDDALAFFTNKQRNGMVVGEKMLNNKGIINTDCDIIDVYTNKSS